MAGATASNARCNWVWCFIRWKVNACSSIINIALNIYLLNLWKKYYWWLGWIEAIFFHITVFFIWNKNKNNRYNVEHTNHYWRWYTSYMDDIPYGTKTDLEPYNEYLSLPSWWHSNDMLSYCMSCQTTYTMMPKQSFKSIEEYAKTSIWSKRVHLFLLVSSNSYVQEWEVVKFYMWDITLTLN